MAGRPLTGAMSTALTAKIVRPVLIGKLDFASDPVTSWTGPNAFAPSGTSDSALNGNIFIPFAPFLNVSSINEGQGTGGPVTLTLSGHDLDEVALRQIVRDKRQWRGRRAWLWLGLLAADESSVIADPIRIKTGVMTQFTVSRDGENHIVAVTIDDDLGNARSAPWRILDHARIFPADTFSTFLIKLSNKPSGLDKYDVNPQAGQEDTLASQDQYNQGDYGSY